MDVFIQYAIAASEFALCDAGLKTSQPLGPGRGRVHRVGDRRLQHDRARAPVASAGRAPQDLAVLHPVRHHQSRRGAGLHPIRRPRAELRHLHRLLGVGARHRRRLRDRAARHRRGDDRGRIGGGHHAPRRGRLRGDARALDAQRRTGARQPAVRPGSRRLHHRRRRRRRRARGARARPAAGRVDLRGAGGLRDVRRRLPRDGAGRGRRRGGPRDGRGAPSRPRSPPSRSTTSTPTGPRRRTTTASRRLPSSAASARTRPPSRSRPPSR